MWIPGHPDALDVFNVVFLMLLLTVGPAVLGLALVLIIQTHPRKSRGGKKEEAAAGPSG